MLGQREMTTCTSLSVTVSHLHKPVTEEVLHQVFDPYGAGNKITVVQRDTQVWAFVEFRSWQEAAYARNSLQGRCIFDCCCYLDIQHAWPTIIPATSTSWASSRASPPTATTTSLVMPDRASLQPATMLSSPSVVLDDRFAATFQVFSKDMMHEGQPKQDVDTLAMENHDGVLTHVGGISLFLELAWDSVDEILGSTDDMCDVVHLEDVSWSDEVLTHVGGLSLFLEFDHDRSIAFAHQVLHGDPPWKYHALYQWSHTREGVGSTIGAGIYVLVGTVAREHAGPALTVSFLIAGIAAALSALCYAELACRFPSAGSAYHYSYICIGESVAWLIGWALILEYTIGGSTVARGISPNLALFFGGQDKLPFFLARVHVKWLDTAVDPCAAILVLIVTALLCLGIKESSLVEGVITIANIAVMLFIIFAGGWLGFRNGWPGYNVPKGYFPNGASGVFSGSATLFFAYIGFDAVASTAEEVKNPQRDLPRGMGLTLSLCCFLYMMVSIVIVGLVPYYAMDPDTPISSAFAQYGMQWAVYVISSGAVLALIASLIGAILPQPRIVMAMARDGLLPPIFSAVDQRTQVPTLSTVMTGICAAILAFFMDVSQLAGMVSVGTLLAFTMVAISILIVRYTPPSEMPMGGAGPGSLESVASQTGPSEPNEEILGDPFGNEAPTASEVANMVRRQKAKRCIVLVCIGVITFVSAVSLSSLPFYIQWTICAFSGLLLLGSTIVLSCIGQDKNSSRKTEGFMCPFVPILPICCILINVYLLMNLGSHTWIRVSVWLAAGALIYLFYGRSHSSLTSTAYQRVSPA